MEKDVSRPHGRNGVIDLTSIRSDVRVDESALVDLPICELWSGQKSPID
jgi:hypothetical protein